MAAASTKRRADTAQRNGQSAGFVAPAVWPKQLESHWEVEVGEGHSSPLVVDSKAYVFSRHGDDEVVSCFALADGKQLWTQSYPHPIPTAPQAANGKGPKSAPSLPVSDCSRSAPPAF